MFCLIDPLKVLCAVAPAVAVAIRHCMAPRSVDHYIRVGVAAIVVANVFIPPLPLLLALAAIGSLRRRRRRHVVLHAGASASRVGKAPAHAVVPRALGLRRVLAAAPPMKGLPVGLVGPEGIKREH